MTHANPAATSLVIASKAKQSNQTIHPHRHCERASAPKQSNKTILLLIFALCLLVSACGTSKPTKFYQLSSSKETVKSLDNRKIVVGVDMVSVSGYIERPQIVTLKNDVELKLSEFNRWAEPLSYSIQRVVAENISKYLKNGMAKAAATKSVPYDYVVSIELNKFDGRFNDKATLDAWWSINDKDGKSLAREHTVLTAPLGEGYDNYVETQTRLLAQLSKKIAQKLSTL